jgi:hypothetical protein
MPDTLTRETQHISKLGWVVLVMAMVSLVTVLTTSYLDRRATECQKNLNERFLVVLKERGGIADGDRQAIRDLVSGLVDAKNEKESQAALLKYDQDNKKLDEQRTHVKYPSETLCTNQ